MRTTILVASALLAFVTPAQAGPPNWAPAHGHRDHDGERHGHGDRKEDRRDRDDDQRREQRNWQRYDWNRPDARFGYYEPSRYYRPQGYQPYRLAANDRIYRGNDGRYYCRRKDGSTGLVIGALLGGVLGNQIAPRGSRLLGSIAGGALGAVLGQSLDQGMVCR